VASTTSGHRGSKEAHLAEERDGLPKSRAPGLSEVARGRKEKKISSSGRGEKRGKAISTIKKREKDRVETSSIGKESLLGSASLRRPPSYRGAEGRNFFRKKGKGLYIKKNRRLREVGNRQLGSLKGLLRSALRQGEKCHTSPHGRTRKKFTRK